ncbi:MAG TPA: SH3 domain-containing protein [Baekduia sp.]|uniref:SH3 domain-containing protein n=1 Tax=Baekduia sp. TaxID=2600305 RepID=UPI002D7803E9|nr:SH3 domain-containing protein [Baekduia sp.]HET6505803.1 SH3 domain-containing protein [Baekduia sp.]
MTTAARAGGASRAARRRRLATAAAGLLAAAVLVAPAGAQARGGGPAPVRVCAERAIVRETPGGLVIGVLEEGDPVRVLKRSRDRVWVRVANNLPAVGWIKAKAIRGR